MVCDNCGGKIPEKGTHCPMCGASQDEVMYSDPIISVEDMYTPSSSPTPTFRGKVVKKPNGFLVGLCCFLAFVFTFSTFLSLLIRDSIKPDNVEEIIDNVDIDDVMEIGGGHIEEFVNNTVSRREMEKIIEESTIPEYVEDLANEYADYLLYGDEPRGINGDDVEALMRENSYIVEQISGYTLTESDYQEINSFFEDNAGEGFGIFAEDVEAVPAMKTVNRVISLPVVILLGVMASIMYLLIFLAMRKSFSAFKNIGVVLILACGIIILAVFAVGVIASFVTVGPIREIANAFVEQFRQSALEICGAGLGAGLFCAVIGAVAKKFSKIEYV